MGNRETEKRRKLENGNGEIREMGKWGGGEIGKWGNWGGGNRTNSENGENRLKLETRGNGEIEKIREMGK